MKAMLFTTMPMFVCLFWSAMLALQLYTEGKNRPRQHLLVFMLTASMLYFGHCVFFNHNTALSPYTDTIYSFANLAVYPLYYLYICSLTIRSEHHKGHWVMMVPAVVGGILTGALYIMMSPEETRQFIDQYLYGGHRSTLTGLAIMQVYVHDVCKALFAFLIIPVLTHGRTHIMEYDQQVRNAYADIEDKTLGSIHHMLVAFIATSILSFVFNIIGRRQFDESSWLLAFPSVAFSVMLFALGYVGYKQQFSIDDIENDEQEADASIARQDGMQELRKKIEQLMEEEELYRQPNIKIVDIVNRLNTNRNYIYQAINHEMGISFNEYINRMRIEHASLLISQHPDMPLSEIAEQSGFTSSTSFYRNFRLYKGMSPKEYLVNMKNNPTSKTINEK